PILLSGTPISAASLDRPWCMTFSRFCRFSRPMLHSEPLFWRDIEALFFQLSISIRPFRGVVMRRTRKNHLQARANRIALPVSLVLIRANFRLSNSQAAENATNFYILGLKTTMAGFTPPPVTYLIDINYFYAGSASGVPAVGIALRRLANPNLPPRRFTLQADINLDAHAQLTAPLLLWVAPEKVLCVN